MAKQKIARRKRPECTAFIVGLIAAVPACSSDDTYGTQETQMDDGGHAQSETKHVSSKRGSDATAPVDIGETSPSHADSGLSQRFDSSAEVSVLVRRYSDSGRDTVSKTDSGVSDRSDSGLLIGPEREAGARQRDGASLDAEPYDTGTPADAGTPTDAGDDNQALPDGCVCVSGPCCNGCEFLPYRTPCDSYPVTSSCTKDTTACAGHGSMIEYWDLDVTCSGASSECDGPTFEGNYYVVSCKNNLVCADDGTGGDSAYCAPCPN